MLRKSWRHLRPWLPYVGVPALLISVGTLGLFLFEPRLTLFQSLYLAVITLTTIGFGDVVPQTTAGRVFVMAYALSGVFALFYFATNLIAGLVSGQLQATFGRQRMENALAGLLDHIIVCGYGRMGRLVAHELSQRSQAFVIVERRPELLEHFDLPHGLALNGDGTADETLLEAGVQRARALISVVSSDADNLFITMSARLLNDKLTIIARAEDESSEQKLKRAGANRSISPYRIGGARIAQAIFRPTVVDFIELATRTTHLELQLEETLVAVASPLIGKSLRDSNLRHDLGVIIVAIKRPSGRMLFNPPPETVIETGDILIVLGDRQKLDALAALARG